jgi:maltooligosyltrehalose trehalohydrolase
MKPETTLSPTLAASAAFWGAQPEEGGTRFHVWAPLARDVEVVLEKFGTRIPYALAKASDGTFSGLVPGVSAGDLYHYRVDGQGPFPDPASRFQPEGVHGPSQVVDPSAFAWTDAGWRGLALEDAVFYELHIGAFTPEGTFAAAAARLPFLLDLGVTAVELMPVADFPGRRNWGYDGVNLFAPARCYGAPDDLRRLVDAAHHLGLAVIQDVVYNHLGPDGNYLAAYSPFYFTDRHQSPWGAGVNLDGENSGRVRDFFIDNALHWIREYHMDGLRLDAVHALVDEGRRHFLAELSARVRDAASDAGRKVVLVAEDNRNLARLVQPESEGGWGFDAVWADDFHHQARRLLAGDRDGYYEDYTGSTEDLAATLRQGWFFCGQHSKHLKGPRGTDPGRLSMDKFVICVQNHDQVGNRALGERLHHQVDLASYRAAMALLLLAPETPLLFMGQEWAASTPFLFFTDHHEDLGRQVTEGRRREFQGFAAFSDPKAWERIPDPQAPATFEASRLNWDEVEREPHASLRRLTRALLGLRRQEPAFRGSNRGSVWTAAAGESGVILARQGHGRALAMVLCQCRGSGTMDAVALKAAGFPGSARSWEVVLTTEDPEFSPDPAKPRVDVSGPWPRVEFSGPGAVVLKARAS